MKPNKPSETYANRVLQFALDEDARREREKKAATPSPNVTAKQPTATPQSGDNPFIHAYAVVFGKLTPEQQTEIKRLENTHNVDNGTYNQFICNVLKEAGEVPSHELRKSGEKCNCFSCRGRK